MYAEAKRQDMARKLRKRKGERSRKRDEAIR
jgi:hypothetical protein